MSSFLPDNTRAQDLPHPKMNWHKPLSVCYYIQIYIYDQHLSLHKTADISTVVILNFYC